MKRLMICLILIIIGLGINKNIAYGSEAAGQNDRGIEVESVTSMYPWVGIDTLEEINQMCQEKKLSANKIKNYLIENSVCLTVKINSQATDRFLIKDSTGINYDCMEENGRVYIYHIISGRKIALDAEKDKFEEFFEDTKKQSEEVNEKIDYLRTNLGMSGEKDRYVYVLLMRTEGMNWRNWDISVKMQNTLMNSFMKN